VVTPGFGGRAARLAHRAAQADGDADLAAEAGEARGNFSPVLPDGAGSDV